MSTMSSSVWDVKTYLVAPNVSEHHDVIYKCVNRHANLIGDLPFEILLMKPLRELVSEFLERMDDASNQGLYSDVSNVTSLALSVMSTLGDYTLLDLARKPPSDFPQHALRLLSKLRAAGIEIPIPTGDEKLRSRRASNLEKLLSVAPNATYKSLFMSEHQDASTDVRATLRQARINSIFGDASKPVPPPPPPAQPTLANCVIRFHTNNEDKDSDTHVTVTVRDDNNVTAAFISNDFGHFDDNSDSGPFGLEIRNPSSIDSLQRGTLTIHIDPNGHDTWRFNLSLLSLLFSDGRQLSGSADGLELTQDRREQTFGLSGILR